MAHLIRNLFSKKLSYSLIPAIIILILPLTFAAAENKESAPYPPGSPKISATNKKDMLERKELKQEATSKENSPRSPSSKLDRLQSYLKNYDKIFQILLLVTSIIVSFISGYTLTSVRAYFQRRKSHKMMKAIYLPVSERLCSAINEVGEENLNDIEWRGNHKYILKSNLETLQNTLNSFTDPIWASHNFKMNLYENILKKKEAIHKLSTILSLDSIERNDIETFIFLRDYNKFLIDGDKIFKQFKITNKKKELTEFGSIIDTLKTFDL